MDLSFDSIEWVLISYSQGEGTPSSAFRGFFIRDDIDVKHEVPKAESDALCGVISVRISYCPGPGKTSTFQWLSKKYSENCLKILKVLTMDLFEIGFGQSYRFVVRYCQNHLNESVKETLVLQTFQNLAEFQQTSSQVSMVPFIVFFIIASRIDCTASD